MFSIRDISIKNKLVLMQVFTSVLVLGLCFAAFVITDIRGYKERKVVSTVSIAQVIGSNSISAILFMDNETAREILQKVEPDIINASIVDPRGNVFAAYTRPGKTAHTFTIPGDDEYVFSDGFLYVYKPIIENKKFLGTVCLQVELTQLEQIKTQKFHIAVILLVIGIGLAFLIALINQRYISMPLLYLVKVMKQIRESNNYNRHVAVNGKDEISTLSLEFNNLMDEVVKSHQKKDEFIGIASHELKTPLTSVKLYLEILARMDHEQTAQKFVLKSKEGVEKLQSLIVDLLDVSKIQSGQLQLNLKELDLEKLVEECVQNIQMHTFTHNILIEHRSYGTIVLADKDRLEQVIVNLISNAIKYSPHGKNILIEINRTGNLARVSIRDFGIGIERSEHKKIFERFYRSKNSNSVISGFGLGLYICSQIIKRHRGTIGVESEEGGGATFYFELPVQG